MNIFIRLKAEKRDYDQYMMFPKTGVMAGIMNALYGIVLVVLTAQTYTLIDMVLTADGGGEILSVGPILFGIFTAGWDWIFLKCKKLAGGILADAKKKAQNQR